MLQLDRVSNGRDSPNTGSTQERAAAAGLLLVKATKEAKNDSSTDLLEDLNCRM